MIRLRKNIFLVALAIFAFANNTPRSVYAITGGDDITDMTGSGIYNNVSVFRIDQNANVYFSSTTRTTSSGASAGEGSALLTITNQGVMVTSNAITLGGSSAGANRQINYSVPGLVVSTTNTSGTSQGNLFYAYLSGNVAATEGMALISTTAVAGQGISVAVSLAAQTQAAVIGFASAAASTGSIVGVYSGGGWVLALGTGTINPGDVLATSALGAGTVQAYSASVSSGIIAIALGSNPVSTGNLLKVRLK